MTETKIDLSKYHNALNRKHQLVRLLWSVVWGGACPSVTSEFGKRMEAVPAAAVRGEDTSNRNCVFFRQSVLSRQFGDGGIQLFGIGCRLL